MSKNKGLDTLFSLPCDRLHFFLSAQNVLVD